MIPRFKPFFDWREIKAILGIKKNAVAKFEIAFAKNFQTKYALAFPYGRSALYALLKALDIKNAEIIIPAYTCVVVPHAIVLSKNIPKFVDINAKNYNLNLDEVIKKISPQTKAIIPGNIFGYPVDTEKLKKITNDKNILIIQDCAHCFGAKWHGQFVCNQGDAAIFGLNIAKYISSIHGGMLTTNRRDIYQKVKTYRDRHFKNILFFRSLKNYFYLLATYPAFNPLIYGLTSYFDYIEGHRILGRTTKYYQENKIDLPPDALSLLSSIEAKVGISLLQKYPKILAKRKIISQYYHDHLQNIPQLVLPPLIDGATYSHYVPRVQNRQKVISQMKKQGIQLGSLINYSIPRLKAYQKYTNEKFPKAWRCSRETINLPIYPDLKKTELDYIITNLKDILSQNKK